MNLNSPDLISNLPDYYKVDGKRYAKSAPDGWIRFLGHDGEFGGTGWKIHVSATTPAAQEALARLAMQHGISEFKFAEKIGELLNPADPQAGKTAVFFHSEKGVDGKAIDWTAFVNQAEEIVHQHGGAGPAVQRDKQVPGAKAVYYRNDRGAKGEAYVPRRGITVYGREHGVAENQLHNMANADDPFAHITLGKLPELIPAGKTGSAESKPEATVSSSQQTGHASSERRLAGQSESSWRSRVRKPIGSEGRGAGQSFGELSGGQASWAEKQWLAFKSAPTSVKVGVIAGGAAAAVVTGWLVNNHRNKDMKEQFTSRLDEERYVIPAASR